MPFPSNPQFATTYMTPGGVTYIWNGLAWQQATVSVGFVSGTPPIPGIDATTVSGALAEHQQDIDGLQASTTANAAGIASNAAGITSNQGGIATNAGEIAANDAEIDANRQEINALKTEHSVFESQDFAGSLDNLLSS